MKYEELQLSENRVFKVAVVSTMSSGKSTLINAFVGQELLPSTSLACTAKLLSVLDNDALAEPRGHILYADQTYKRVDNCTIDVVRTYNNSTGKPISDIIVECNITGIHNAKTALLLVDTPGVNNHLDTGHRDITRGFLQSLTEGLVLYMVDATQAFTCDSDTFLREVQALLKDRPQVKTLFVVNKADSIDPERKDLSALIGSIASKLKEIGFEYPKLIPVSAQAALELKKSLSGAAMTRTQQRAFPFLCEEYSQHAKPCRDLREFVWDDRLQSMPPIQIEDREYSPAQLYRALEQTGIPTLEREIESCMLQATAPSAPLVKKIKIEKGTSGR